MAFDDFFRGYMEAALWSSTDNSTPSGGEPLDANFDVEDIDPSTTAKMGSDCIDFLNYVERSAKEVVGGLAALAEDKGLDLTDATAVAIFGDFALENGFTIDEVNAFKEQAPLIAMIEQGDLETEQAGHDFWLSRNGHGAGFFDGDYGGAEHWLQDMARSFGEYHLDVVFPDDYEISERGPGDTFNGEAGWFFTNPAGYDEGPFEHYEQAAQMAIQEALANGEAHLTGG